ncbi:hypothetical protein BofuT4_P078700.1 [Botrytis cinerea T4]|uniref:Uncharacterized protein n=1 Tax=Botryotinia fuckeliana (strain T4) TaxID=999810 RepID=G2YL57_BOTF4|nr:hypothetical protein BofuT4_P078700.1 [Botrytis cinerea T4]
MKDLEAAISAAERKHIVMFCSASDQSRSSTSICYPGDWNRWIQIGAATATGDEPA